MPDRDTPELASIEAAVRDAARDILAGVPMDGAKTARLANRMLDQCFKANLNRLEISTALGLVAETAFQDVPNDYFQAWVDTLRRKLRLTDA